MGLKLKFSICQSEDCKSLEFSELTGSYSLDSNPTGWGSPNTLILDITTATLSITTPTGTTPTIINIFNIQTPNGFPTIDNPSIAYDLTSIDINNTNTSVSLDDGLYIFKYEVYDATNDQYYSTIKEVLLTCNVECCIKKLAIKIADGTCCEGCINEDIDKFLTGFALLQTLKNLAGCGNTVSIAKTLKTLQNLCSKNNCGCE